METIVTNVNARDKRIAEEVKRAFDKCKEAANNGREYVYFTTDRDIQMDVRDLLESNHKIYVPTIISRYEPSRIAVEHNGEKTEIKLSW